MMRSIDGPCEGKPVGLEEDQARRAKLNTHQTLRYPSSEAETITLVEFSSAKQTPLTMVAQGSFSRPDST